MRYCYITRIEVLESTDPKMPAGMEFCMLGHITEKAMWRVDRRNRNLVFARLKVLEHYELPKLMTKPEAWEWFKENIEESLFNDR